MEVAPAHLLDDVQAHRGEAHVDKPSDVREPFGCGLGRSAAALNARARTRIAELAQHADLVLEVTERADGAYGLLGDALDDDATTARSSRKLAQSHLRARRCVSARSE